MLYALTDVALRARSQDPEGRQRTVQRRSRANHGARVDATQGVTSARMCA